MGFDNRETEAVLRVMQSGNLSGYLGNVKGMYGGPEVQALEREWAEYFGVRNAIAINSATSGLWCALNSVMFGSYSDEVIVTPYSMTCSASMPLNFGVEAVFADIEADYFCLDVESVRSKITKNTKAIVVVDLFGQPYDADGMRKMVYEEEIKHGTKIVIVEDAAQAIGAKYKGRHAGTLGDIGVYSLNYHKHINCGEGGIVVTHDDALATRIRLSMNHAEAITNDYKLKGGADARFESLIGMNLRMTELQAAIARVQLEKLEGILEIYRDDAKYFPVRVRPRCEHSYYRYAWTKKTTLEFMECNPEWLMKNGYITPIYKMPLFSSLGYNNKQCPVCEDVEKNITLAWRKEQI